MTGSVEVSGFVHLHLTDAWSGPDELVAAHRSRGYQFLALTDHPEEVGAEEFERRADGCRRASDDGFLCLYGLEGRTASGPHVMGIGVRSYVPLGELDLVAAITAIREAGGVAVLAHPSVADLTHALRLGARPDGIEVWNALRAGWAPNAPLLQALARSEWRDLPHFGGPDAHRRGHLFKVATVTRVPRLARDELLHCLRQGDFAVRRGPVRMAGRSEPAGLGVRLLFQASRRYLRLMRAFKRMARSVGVQLPAGVHAALEWTA